MIEPIPTSRYPKHQTTDALSGDGCYGRGDVSGRMARMIDGFPGDASHAAVARSALSVAAGRAFGATPADTITIRQALAKAYLEGEIVAPLFAGGKRRVRVKAA